jgi:SNF2 family DNA or RNA helicase
VVGKSIAPNAYLGGEKGILGPSDLARLDLDAIDPARILANLQLEPAQVSEVQLLFEKHWNEGVDVKPELLRRLAELSDPQSPEFLYFKTLYHILEKQLNSPDLEAELKSMDFFQTEVWRKLFGFQKDGVKGLLNRMRIFQGCILADSVGLGKTLQALAVIKYYELRNQRVLVLCPKKLGSNWLQYRQNSKENPFNNDLFGYDVLFHTDLNRLGGEQNGIDLSRISWGNYGLVVIDESHNFRNNNYSPETEIARRFVRRSASGLVAVRDEAGSVSLARRRITRWERLIDEVIGSGCRSHVLLLSATPVNNDLADLRNQISLIAGSDVATPRRGESNRKADSAFKAQLGVNSVNFCFQNAQQRFNEWYERGRRQEERQDLLTTLGPGFASLLDSLTIARSRRHIKEHYKEEMKRIGSFPVRLPPVNFTPPISSHYPEFTFQWVADEIEKLSFAVYKPVSYLQADLPDEILRKYQVTAAQVQQFNQGDRETALAGMMRINFLKRLESSCHAFRETLGRTIKRIVDSIERIDAGEGKLVSAMDDQDEESEEEESVQLVHVDTEAWRADLLADLAILDGLNEAIKDVMAGEDPKLEKLVEYMEDAYGRENAEEGGSTKKFLIFTASSDTAEYLYEKLRNRFRCPEFAVGCLTGNSQKTNRSGQPAETFERLLIDFSPISKGRPSDCDRQSIDILIATDCISEGQNLQDCDTVINYDIHWNPVRVIQRFGRIDRIGSKWPSIQMVNFWPTDDFESIVSLRTRVERRIAMISAVGDGDANLLNPEEDLIDDEINFRVNQLERIRKEVIDLEELGGGFSLADFSLVEMRKELEDYLQANRDRVVAAPFGLGAAVAADSEGASAFFCLRAAQHMEVKPGTRVGQFAPYFIVYIKPDGTVRSAPSAGLPNLSKLRGLCLGKNIPDSELQTEFDRLTAGGIDFSAYSKMANSAVESVMAALRDSDQSEVASKGFELITWFARTPILK